MNTPPSKTLIGGEGDSEVKQNAPFEVEIQTGNRAERDRRAHTDVATKPSAPSPLALQRQQRTRQRRRLLAYSGLLMGLALVVWGTAVWWQPILQRDVVARVNGRPITMQQIDQEIRLSKAISMAATGKESAPAPPSIMEQLILAEVKAQAARQANFSVTPEEVEAELASVTKLTRLSPEKLDESLSRYGLTRDDLRASMANTTLADRFVKRYVVNGIADPKARVDKIDRWQSDLLQLARIERVRNPANGNAPRVGAEAPDFALMDTNGKEVRLSSLRGKTVMLNFWAPWCPPCRAEMPVLQQTYQEYAAARSQGGGFELLGIATQSELANVIAFVQEYGNTFPTLMDTQNEATGLYQVGPIPTSYFIDGRGIVRAVHIGQLDAATLRRYLDAVR